MNNKSTPLTQLPNSAQSQQPQYVNDQHRQLIAQAHTAAQNFTMPVNTQLGGDYSRDEDATIQETLMHLNGSDSPPSSNGVIQQLPPLQSLPSLPAPSLSSLHHYQPPSQSQSQSMPMTMSMAMPIPVPAPLAHLNTSSAHTNAQQLNNGGMANSDPWWSFLGESSELKLVGLVILITLLLTLIPIERLINEYLPSMISKLPYSNIVGRAISAGVMFYVSQALLV